MEMLEHETRSMLDGAVHDIEEVAKVVAAVKHNLQVKTSEEYKKVGVALAGRALQTLSNKIEKEISITEEITSDQVRNLELEAVGKLLQQLPTMSDFHCVGYSVVYQELDGVRLRNLVGQRGAKVAIEVIATFLPRTVIDSLFAVLKKVELEPISVTLEPIAAISVIIPQDMRQLNLALVDIGAGTSDIAITRDGSVVAYGMVPEAGDEITEALCGKYLLEFSEGERLKKNVEETFRFPHKGHGSLKTSAAVSVENIMGVKKEIIYGEVLEFLEQPVKTLAENIAREIIDLNGSVPQAVVCVGGGSLTPLLQEKLAELLNISEENVGIRGPEKILNLHDETGRLTTPDMVTPIGIASISSKLKGLKFIHAYVNNKEVQLLEVEQSIDVLSALVAAGIDATRMYGRPGLGISYEFEGQIYHVKGGLGSPAKILLNGKEAGLKEYIKNEDIIQFVPADSGEDAIVKIKDLGFETIEKISVKVNDQIIDIEIGRTDILVNGRIVDLEDYVPDRAKIELRPHPIGPVFLSQIFKYINVNPEELKGKRLNLLLNFEPAGFNTPLVHGSEVSIGFN
jgi:cell division ATPase FtsA